MKYKFLDELQSDVIYEAYGKTIEELLVNAAEAMASVISQTHRIKPEKSVSITVEGEDYEELMYNWLSQILVESELKEIFFSKFEAKVSKKKPKGFTAKGKALGEKMLRDKGETVIKAVTYYKFKVEERKEGFYARISCDV